MIQIIKFLLKYFTVYKNKSLFFMYIRVVTFRDEMFHLEIMSSLL